MKPIPDNLRQTFHFTLGQEDTAQALGNPGVAVISTVALILKIEDACFQLVLPYYETDDATVGTKVSVDHLAPAVIDEPISVTATLPRREGRILDFQVTIEQSGRQVMTGSHQRRLVALSRFIGPESAPKASPRQPGIEFWFDLHSPWCYAASHRIGNIARRHNTALHWRPVHLANLIEAIDGRRPLEANPAFVRWYKQDLLDTYEALGLPFKEHPDYPLRPSRAQRACLYAEENGFGEVFAMALLKGYWSQSLAIDDLSALEEVARSVGLDPKPLAQVIADEHYKQIMADNLQEAIDKGLFGLPAALYGGKIYWGNDRLDLLDQALAQLQT